MSAPLGWMQLRHRPLRLLVALLGIGAMEKKPVVRNDEIVIREMMPISLTFDHRIIDGATAGEFRNRMKRLVENPELIISYF